MANGLFQIKGPRPDLDPDIVAALDDALDLDDPDNILEDDFMLQVCHVYWRGWALGHWVVFLCKKFYSH